MPLIVLVDHEDRIAISHAGDVEQLDGAKMLNRPLMARCAGGGIILSSVATRYQLGFTRQAGLVT